MNSCDKVKTGIRLVGIKFAEDTSSSEWTEPKLGSGINILHRIELILALSVTLIIVTFKAKSRRFFSWSLIVKY